MTSTQGSKIEKSAILNICMGWFCMIILQMPKTRFFEIFIIPVFQIFWSIVCTTYTSASLIKSESLKKTGALLTLSLSLMNQKKNE